jgi:hypothetical protein
VSVDGRTLTSLILIASELESMTNPAMRQSRTPHRCWAIQPETEVARRYPLAPSMNSPLPSEQAQPGGRPVRHHVAWMGLSRNRTGLRSSQDLSA